MFFKPADGWIGDIIPIYHNGRYYIYYLKDYRTPDHAHLWDKNCWALMETEDFVHFTPEKLLAVPAGTGDVFYHDGKWHLYKCDKFYVSDDMAHWEEDTVSAVAGDGRIYKTDNWRDPRVFFDPENGEYCMLTAAKVNLPAPQDPYGDRVGCVSLCTSRDMKTWTHQKPFFYSRRFSDAAECPDYFRIGDWHYLVYSHWSDGKGTYYAKARTLHGPWLLPRDDMFDGRSLYAAKTAGHDGERYLFAWCPTRTRKETGICKPDCDWFGDDFNTWDYAGSMVIHKLVQQPNGDLYARPVSQIADTCDREAAITARAVTPDWQTDAAGRSLHANNQTWQSMYRFGGAPSDYVLRFTYVHHGAREAGVILRADERCVKGYYLYFDDRCQRIALRSGHRAAECVADLFPFDTEMERPLTLEEGKRYEVTILAEGEIGVIYVGGQTALSFRMIDFTADGIAFYVYDGEASFEQISVRTKTGKE